MGSPKSTPVQETVNNNVMAAAPLEVSTISFHGPTLLQSVVASLGCIVIAVLCYIAFKYCGICGRNNTGELPEHWPEQRLRRWSLRSVKGPREAEKSLSNFHNHGKMVP